MYTLGIGGSNHDFSSCLLDNSKILYMIEDERITRKKHAKNLGVEIAQGFSRKYCLQEAGLKISDIDMIVANDLINPAILFHLPAVKMIDHHLAHASSAYYCSPYNNAAILVVDSVGSKKVSNDGEILYNTVSIFQGFGNRISTVKKFMGKNLKGTDYVENSLGIFYTLVTEAVGFNELQEGKTMGLAPYGTDSFYDELCKIIKFSNGCIEMKKEGIDKLRSYKRAIDNLPNEKEINEAKRDFAYSAQKLLEELLIQLCVYTKEITNAQYLCMAGGVALNSVANYKIYKKKIYNNIFIQPAAGDNGTSIGSALYGYYEISNNDRCM